MADRPPLNPGWRLLAIIYPFAAGAAALIGKILRRTSAFLGAGPFSEAAAADGRGGVHEDFRPQLEDPRVAAIADEHDGKPRHQPMLYLELRDRGGYFLPDCGGNGFSVNDSGNHALCLNDKKYYWR